MKLIGLMTVKNEEWVLAASIHAALQWCDGLAIFSDGSMHDDTNGIIRRAQDQYPDRISARWANPTEYWQEMSNRHKNYVDGREMKGTHFAIIDADEILTATLRPHVRNWFRALSPGQILDVPMISVWRDLNHQRADKCIWTNRTITLGFRDTPNMGWGVGPDGYDHHSRAPRGTIGQRMEKRPGTVDGGVMHLQFVNQRRLLAKHVLYRMTEFLRWPGRDTIEKINWRYDLALNEEGLQLESIPPAWWSNIFKDRIALDTEPWHETEVRRLLEKHGREKFNGLDLKGF